MLLLGVMQNLKVLVCRATYLIKPIISKPATHIEILILLVIFGHIPLRN